VPSTGDARGTGRSPGWPRSRAGPTRSPLRHLHPLHGVTAAPGPGTPGSPLPWLPHIPWAGWAELGGPSTPHSARGARGGGSGALRTAGTKQRIRFTGNFWNCVITGKRTRVPTHTDSKPLPKPHKQILSLKPEVCFI